MRQLQRSVRVTTGTRKNEPMLLRNLGAIGRNDNASVYRNTLIRSQLVHERVFLVSDSDRSAPHQECHQAE